MAHERVRGAEEVIDHLAADHELRHQREERDRDEQVRVELAEHEIAKAAEMTLERVENGRAEKRQAREHRHAGQQHGDEPDENQREQHLFARPSPGAHSMP